MNKNINKLSLCLVVFLSAFASATAQQSYFWLELGTGANALNANDNIYGLTTDDQGNIYAGGFFTDASGSEYLAKWDGSSWSELGIGANALNANNGIIGITTDASGNIYVGGAFTDASGHNYVAKWDGTSWSELGTGANALNANNYIYALTTDASGNIYAGGYFTDASGSRYVAKWDGASWSELGAGANVLNANSDIYTLTTDASGNIYAGGYFTDASGSRYVAKWDGASWSELGTGVNALNANSTIQSLASTSSGNIYAVGDFTDASGSRYVAKWDGTSWSELGTEANALNANSEINRISIDISGNIYVGGFFTNASGHYYVAKWDGTSWSELGTGANALNANDVIKVLTADASGNVYAGGAFTDASGHHYVAKSNVLTNCSGTPGTSIISPANVTLTSCGQPPIFTLPAYVGIDGLTYQWQQSIDGSTYTSMPGATNATYTGYSFPAGISYLNCVVTCTASNQSTLSSADTIISSSVQAYANLPYTQDFESWINHCDILDAPDSNWTNMPSTGLNSWRRDDQGATAGWGSNEYPTTYGPYEGSHFARFNIYANNGDTGTLDLHINCTGSNAEQLIFYYINQENGDGMTVSVSVDSGATFMQLASYAEVDNWTQETLWINSNSPKAIVRFTATSDYGYYDIGIDALNIDTSTSCSNVTAGIITNLGNNSFCASGSSTLMLPGATSGPSITYQWQSSTDGVTWANTGTDSDGYTTGILNVTTLYRNIVTCTTSNVSDTTPFYTITINPVVIPTVDISASLGDTICAGTSVTFTATSTNAGTTPSYQWTKNSSAVSNAGTTYVDNSLNNNDIIFCTLTSSLTCATPVVVNSDTLTITVNPLPTPVITTNGTQMSTDNYTSYQWYMNGQPISGATAQNYTATANGVYYVTVSDLNSCIGQSAGYNMQDLDIINTTGIQQLHLYPDPNTGDFVVKGTFSSVNAKKIYIEIENTIGQIVYSAEEHSDDGILEKHIVLSNSIANGLYLLHIDTNMGSSVFKFIVSR